MLPPATNSSEAKDLFADLLTKHNALYDENFALKRKNFELKLLLRHKQTAEDSLCHLVCNLQRVLGMGQESCREFLAGMKTSDEKISAITSVTKEE
ncbi:hypothetical protein LTR95_017904, partial [Oleoguttula sp. CCFEE 5521]